MMERGHWRLPTATGTEKLMEERKLEQGDGEANRGLEAERDKDGDTMVGSGEGREEGKGGE